MVCCCDGSLGIFLDMPKRLMSAFNDEKVKVKAVKPHIINLVVPPVYTPNHFQIGFSKVSCWDYSETF